MLLDQLAVAHDEQRQEANTAGAERYPDLPGRPGGLLTAAARYDECGEREAHNPHESASTAHDVSV